ncbi:dihem cytochrome c [mine drainage metagenome]|uniref:Dihem cytochrome c n=1 Tax=mine drainage metagenome TaxID=410659 RepID=A0A1J5TIV6_9ZZZZ
MMMHTKFKAALLTVALLTSSSAAMAEENFWQWLVTFTRQKEVKPVDNKTYADECGSCHYAYPPGLLPGKSWAKLLDEKALNDHFGENASLDKATLKAIYDYAMENAAEKSWYKRSRKIAVATEDETPLRITDVRYIKRKHHDIPEKMIKGNKDVKSLSYCNACHTQADKGIFDSDTVSIPNYPDWD